MSKEIPFEKSFASSDKAKYWSDKNELKPEQVALQSNKKFWFNCSCGHEFEKILSTIIKNTWCPYQHFTNSIENFFSMFKSRLSKLDGLTYNELKVNINKVINNIPKDKFLNIFKGAYNRKEKYIKRSITRKKQPKNYK